MTIASTPSASSLPGALRLIWPQWQGATAANATALVPEVAAERARRGYAVGAQVLQAVLPPHDGPTAVVDVPTGDRGEGSTAGIESRATIIGSLQAALDILADQNPTQVLTIGGECSVSVAPFSFLQKKYGDDFAFIWIDSHPDTDTADTGYDGYHAMAVSTLLGHGDSTITAMLPAIVPTTRVAYAGMHDGEPDALVHLTEWGLPVFGPDDLRTTSEPLLSWLAASGATKVAIHLDVDVVDSNEAVLGLGEVPGGLTRTQVHRVIADIGEQAEIVGLTLAEFVPRSVLQLQEMIDGLPLVGTAPVSAAIPGRASQ